jgi:hypothetical protein
MLELRHFSLDSRQIEPAVAQAINSINMYLSLAFRACSDAIAQQSKFLSVEIQLLLERTDACLSCYRVVLNVTLQLLHVTLSLHDYFSGLQCIVPCNLNNEWAWNEKLERVAIRCKEWGKYLVMQGTSHVIIGLSVPMHSTKKLRKSSS